MAVLPDKGDRGGWRAPTNRLEHDTELDRLSHRQHQRKCHACNLKVGPQSFDRADRNRGRCVVRKQVGESLAAADRDFPERRIAVSYADNALTVRARRDTAPGK